MFYKKILLSSVEKTGLVGFDSILHLSNKNIKTNVIFITQAHHLA